MKSRHTLTRDLAGALKRQSARTAQATLPGTAGRRGVVATVGTDGTITTTDGIRALRMESYVQPAVGDTVVLSQGASGAWYVLDRLASTDTAAGWTAYTPTVAGGTVTLSSRDGWWRRIAPKLVAIEVFLAASAAGSGGTITVTLPTVPYRGSSNRRQVVPGYAGSMTSGGGPCMGLILAGGSGAVFDQVRSAADTAITGAMFTSSTIITLTGLYREA